MTADEQKIAGDLDLCDLGMALTRGSLRRRYVRHRAKCFAAIAEMNRRDGLDGMSDDDLLRELS